MKSISTSQFVTKSNIEIIQGLLESNNGYITSKLISSMGIHRMYLKQMHDKDMLVKLKSGIYIDPRIKEDLYYTFSISMPNVIFSHFTALYLHKFKALGNYRNLKYDITTDYKYNCKYLKEQNVFYVSKEIYDIGTTITKTNMGNRVRLYDIERCICDVIRSINRLDKEIVICIVKEYLKRKDKNLRKLAFYASKMGIKSEVMNFLNFIKK